MASMVTEANSLKTGDLCCRNGRKKLKEKELKHSGCHLPVRLGNQGNHNEKNSSWEVFWLIRKVCVQLGVQLGPILIYMPCIKNSRATSKNMVCN